MHQVTVRDKKGVSHTIEVHGCTDTATASAAAVGSVRGGEVLKVEPADPVAPAETSAPAPTIEVHAEQPETTPPDEAGEPETH